jgi:hypothetical protein
MAAKLKIDQLESVDGSTNIILNNSVTMAANKTLPAASLTGTLPAISGANLTGVGVSTLSELSDVTVSTSDPAVSTNPSATGHLWVNKTSGETYICSDATAGANVWKNMGDGSDNIETTYSIEYLVIAGGGGQGQYGANSSYYSAGGGAGGLRNSYASEASGGGGSSETAFTATKATAYTITVGAAGTNNNAGTSTDGSDSALHTITSAGGGRGNTQTGTGSGGNAGGSGAGGSGGSGSTGTSPGGAGTANQGYAGGTVTFSVGTPGGAGGGGAGGVGANFVAASSQPASGVGGVGVASAITGSSITYCVGGTGYRAWAGATSGNTSGYSNDANLGHGGTAGNANTISGSSGVVILRMLDANYSGTTTGSPTVTTNVGSSGYTVVKFTGSGTYTG